LRPKTEIKGGLLGEGLVEGGELRPGDRKQALRTRKPPKMHLGPILSINFVSFIAQIYNALRMQCKRAMVFGILGDGPFAPSPKSAYGTQVKPRSANLVDYTLYAGMQPRKSRAGEQKTYFMTVWLTLS